MASTTYRVIQEQPLRGIFTKEQIDAAIRKVNTVLAEREAKQKARARASAKKAPRGKS